MKNQQINIHGVLSLILVLIAFSIGVTAIAKHTLFISCLSVLTIILFFYLVTLTYCAKCSCRENCSHSIIGKISAKLTKCKPKNYTIADLLYVMVPLLIVVLLHQVWLLKNVYLLSSYWLLLGFAAIDIYTNVCPICLNRKCKMCSNSTICND